MNRKAKIVAVRLTIEAALAFAVIVFAAIYFEAELQRINWRLVALLSGFAAVGVAIYRWQIREDNTYDVIDMVMTAGKADLDKHLTIFSFALAVWLVVQQALAKQPVTELMLGVLGFFVLKRASAGFSDAMQRRPPPVDQSQNVNVLPGAQVTTAPRQPSGE